jgi:hypothetical protein
VRAPAPLRARATGSRAHLERDGEDRRREHRREEGDDDEKVRVILHNRRARLGLRERAAEPQHELAQDGRHQHQQQIREHHRHDPARDRRAEPQRRRRQPREQREHRLRAQPERADQHGPEREERELERGEAEPRAPLRARPHQPLDGRVRERARLGCSPHGPCVRRVVRPAVALAARAAEVAARSRRRDRERVEVHDRRARRRRARRRGRRGRRSRGVARERLGLAAVEQGLRAGRALRLGCAAEALRVARAAAQRAPALQANAAAAHAAAHAAAAAAVRVGVRGQQAERVLQRGAHVGGALARARHAHAHVALRQQAAQRASGRQALLLQVGRAFRKFPGTRRLRDGRLGVGDVGEGAGVRGGGGSHRVPLGGQPREQPARRSWPRRARGLGRARRAPLGAREHGRHRLDRSGPRRVGAEKEDVGDGVRAVHTLEEVAHPRRARPRRQVGDEDGVVVEAGGRARAREREHVRARVEGVDGVQRVEGVGPDAHDCDPQRPRRHALGRQHVRERQPREAERRAVRFGRRRERIHEEERERGGAERGGNAEVHRRGAAVQHAVHAARLEERVLVQPHGRERPAKDGPLPRDRTVGRRRALEELGAAPAHERKDDQIDGEHDRLRDHERDELDHVGRHGLVHFGSDY